MLIDVFQKLLDIRVTTRVQIGIVDVDNHILEVVLLLLPLQVLLELWQAESFEEYLDAQMLEIVWIKLLDWFMRKVVWPPFKKLTFLFVILQEVIDVRHCWVLRIVSSHISVHHYESEVDKKNYKL
jgi:hypothetical protein